MPIDGEPACHGNGSTIGFKMESPEQVDAWHAAGVANGGTTCEDPPGICNGSVGRLYLAYLRDLDATSSARCTGRLDQAATTNLSANQGGTP